MFSAICMMDFLLALTWDTNIKKSRVTALIHRGILSREAFNWQEALILPIWNWLVWIDLTRVILSLTRWNVNICMIFWCMIENANCWLQSKNFYYQWNLHLIKYFEYSNVTNSCLASGQTTLSEEKKRKKPIIQYIFSWLFSLLCCSMNF